MEQRIGDIIEDHCTRCARLTDHSVVAMVGPEVAKVQCRTCGTEHGFRHGKGGRPKTTGKQAAFDAVLAGILGESRPVAPTGRKRKPKV